MDLSALERAVTLDPNDASAQLAWGEALILAERPGEALVPLRRALALRRDLIEAYLALGRALLAEGEHVAAIATLEGGREMAKKGGRLDLVPAFDEALAGLGSAKRRTHAPLDAAAFDRIAQSMLGGIAARAAAVSERVSVHATPSVVVLAVAGGRKLGLSEQRTAREIWCSSPLGEIRFRHIESSGHWRAAQGEELLATVERFLTDELGTEVSLR